MSNKVKNYSLILFVLILALLLSTGCSFDASTLAGSAAQVTDTEQTTPEDETKTSNNEDQTTVDEESVTPQEDEGNPGAEVAANAGAIVAEDQSTEAAQVMSYVLNTNTKKFHEPDCRSVGTIKDSNRQDVEATRDEVISWGYDPCGNCHP